MYRLISSLLVCLSMSLISGCASTAFSRGPTEMGEKTFTATDAMPSQQPAPSNSLLQPEQSEISEQNPDSSQLLMRPQHFEDLWQRIRAGMQLSRSDSDVLPSQLSSIKWYQDHKESLRRTFTRGRLYLFDIVQACEQEGVPLEIALLPAVESAFRPEAVSTAAADGLWQFISSTGKNYALRQHLFLDDRRDIRASTRSALKYLKDLNVMFGGDWKLALSAYNCGPSCVQKAVRVARAHGLAGHFEDLRLPAETRAYVPRLLALSRVVADPALYGVELPQMHNAAYFVAVPITRDIDVDTAASLAGISVAEFRALNPSHKKSIIFAAATIEICIPVEREPAFVAAMKQNNGPLSKWTVTTVPKRTSIVALAKAYGATERELRAVNGIAPGRLVTGGSTIVVPRNGRVVDTEDVAAQVIETATLGTTAAFVTRRVRVRKGDTWAQLARRIKVTEVALKSWNRGLMLRRGLLALNVPVDVAERITLTHPGQPNKRRIPPAIQTTTKKLARGASASRGQGV